MCDLINQQQAVIDIVELAHDYGLKISDELQQEYDEIMKGRKNTMKAVYECTLKVKIVHDVEDLKNIKDNKEFAEDLAQMICDEATVTNGVGVVEVVESSLDVK